MPSIEWSGVRRGAGGAAVAIVVATSLAACSREAEPSMSVSTNQISVSASLTDPAPSATVDVTVANPPETGLQLGYNTTNNGVSAVALQGTHGNTATILVSFKAPVELGIGTYQDTLLLAVCKDAQCAQQIANSPQTILVTYTVTAGAVSLTSISPSALAAGGPGFTLTAYGSGFTAASTVQWNGSSRPTTYLSPTLLTAQIPASDIVAAGQATVTVSDPAGTSNGVVFTIQSSGGLSLGSLSPDSVIAGGPGFTLTANGSSFTAASTVRWNGSDRPTTHLSPTQLVALIDAADVSAPGTATVTVSDPVGGVSNGLPFAIQPPAAFALGALYPSWVMAGGPDFVLWLFGTGFTVSSTVMWNGAPRATAYVSPTELTASVSAADIAVPGTASISVQNSAGTSNALTFAIRPVSKDAVSFQVTPSHSGVIDFDSVSFPTASAWSVDLGGAPSYPLIAEGKVFVTVSVSGNTQLVALDQATGATAWSPISIAGAANAAYDGGTVFVLSSMFGNPALMQAFDAASGALRWSTLLAGQYAFSSAPTAANGLVFAAGAGYGGTLYAVDAGNGAIAWTMPVANGDSSIPAVTADGVYVTYPCQTYDFRPATGALLWHDDTGCSGGGGATPVVANGVIYAPNGFGSYDGFTFDARTGALLGSYAADNPPAIGAQMGFFLQNGTLRGITLADSTIRWSFAGDGTVVTSPIGVSQYVIVGSSSGKLYALDGTTGTQVWTANLGAALPPGAGWGARMPFSGLGAGDGLLVVPAGNTLTAYTLSTNP
ncbi:MAG TPA: PQQ-binding-like beta-propeller repeat protein [Anaeromyxobacteraceae bacterium]|nr:PQQ-binding-like beta-propeller repeat protein [Anaeromyxobacteraceae bacterium]